MATTGPTSPACDWQRPPARRREDHWTEGSQHHDDGRFASAAPPHHEQQHSKRTQSGFGHLFRSELVSHAGDYAGVVQVLAKKHSNFIQEWEEALLHQYH